MAAAKGAWLNHIARESNDIKRLAKFYIETLGFEQLESPEFGFGVIWLNLGSELCLHLIERDPKFNLPEGPYSATSAVKDPSHLFRGHHICLSLPDFDSFLQSLKDKGIEIAEKTLPDGKTRQVFFFDPDGNGLEVSSATRR